MKGKKWKILYGLFLAVVSCLLYNTLFTLKNASAVELTINVDLTGNSWVINNLLCKYSNGVDKIVTGGNCVMPYSGWSGGIFNAGITQIITTNTVPAKKGYYYKGLLALKSDSGSPSLIWNMDTTSDWVLTSIQEISKDAGLREISIKCGTTSASPNYCAEQLPWSGSILEEKYAKFYEVTLQAKKDGELRWGFGNGSRKIVDIGISGTIDNIYLGLFNIQEMLSVSGSVNEEAQKELEDRDNLESQSQQTSGDANSAEQQMSSGTSSLISVVTSFSNAMIGVRRTNCKLPRMTAYDFDLGELDLCTYSPPAWIQTITSAVVSLIVVRLAYKIFKRIMGIAKGISK